MAPNTLQQNQQGTMNDLRKFVQDLQKGRFEKLSEILNQYTNDQPEQWNK